MGLFDDFRKGREQVRSAAGMSPSPPRDRGSPPRPPQGNDSNGPSPIKIGYYCPLDADAPGNPLYSHTERHILMLGLNGAGKSTRFLIELLATARNRSLVVFDIKGELAFQTADIRRRFSDVKIVNPLGVLQIPSDGYNLLSALDPQSDKFYDAAASIGDALIEVESGAGQYWSESAQGLLVALIMYEVLTARSERRPPSLFNVRRMLTEADEYAPGDVMRKRPMRGLSVTAARMVASGNDEIASLAGRFVRQHGLNELAGIQSTASTQTEWMLSAGMRADMEKQGTDLRQLRQRPTTIYIVMDAEEISKKRRWTRAVIASALSAHFAPGPMSTLFVLDEFRAAVGKMQIISDMWSVVRGYGVQLMPIVQSAVQLKALFEDEWENYAAQAGLVLSLGPAGDDTTAEWMSKRCGVTTILQASLSENDGYNIGDGTSSGTGASGGGASSNQGNSQNSGRNRGAGMSWQQTESRVLLPQEIKNIRSGHGLAWVPGMGTKTIPFFAPNYFRRREPWVREVRPNPYRAG
jgi:type IV secretion system protein VirD4